jgi:hypothetical protein
MIPFSWQVKDEIGLHFGGCGLPLEILPPSLPMLCCLEQPEVSLLTKGGALACVYRGSAALSKGKLVVHHGEEAA